MATGMITRHFDHPSGATATLEMPAGWSRNCYYELVTRPPIYDGGESVDRDRKTFATPDEARQRAIERERQALANGWRPRMAARATSIPEVFTLYRPTGERIDLRVLGVERRGERLFSSRGRHAFEHQLAEPAEYLIHARGDGDPVRAGDRLLFRQVAERGEMLAALMTLEVDILYETMSEYEPSIAYDLRCVQTAFDDGEQTAIERFHDREQVILDLIDDPNPSVAHLWQEISKRVQEPSDRAQVQQEILRRRAERQAAEAREIEQQASRERQEALEAVRAMQAASRPPASTRRQQPLPVAQEDTEAAMRRLAGGQDFSKPKRRKIDLAE